MAGELETRARLYAEGSIESLGESLDAAYKRADLTPADRVTLVMEIITEAIAMGFKVGFHAGTEQHERRRK